MGTTIILLAIIAGLLILLMCTNSAETLLKAEIEKLHNYYENIINTHSDYHKYVMDNMLMQIKELEDKIKEYESIKQIELNEELVLKFGFKEYCNHNEDGDEIYYYKITTPNGKYIYLDYGSLQPTDEIGIPLLNYEIKYVHEFQKFLEDKIKEHESIDNKIESNTLGWVLPPNEPNIGDKIRVFYNDYKCYYEGIYEGSWRVLISINCYCCDFDKWMLIEPCNKIKS